MAEPQGPPPARAPFYIPMAWPFIWGLACLCQLDCPFQEKEPFSACSCSHLVREHAQHALGPQCTPGRGGRRREGEGQRRDAFLRGSAIQQNLLHGICGEGPIPVTGHRSTQQESDFILTSLPWSLLWLPTSHSPNSSAAHPRLPRLLTPPCPRASLYSRGDTSSWGDTSSRGDTPSQAGVLLPALHTAISSTPQVCAHVPPPRTLPRVPPLRASRWHWYFSGELSFPRGSSQGQGGREGGRPGHSRFSPKEEAQGQRDHSSDRGFKEPGLGVRPPPVSLVSPNWLQ